MSGYQSDKIRAVVLSALMVLSVMVGTVAFAGTAAAVNVSDGQTIYQGQEDIQFGTSSFTDSAGNSGPYNSLTGISGNAEGQVLSSGTIPQDQTVGRYSSTGDDSPGDDFSVTVDTPRITDVEVVNPGGADLAGGTVAQQDADNLDVNVDYNFESAEDIEITVEEEGGLEVTNDVVTSSTTDGQGGTGTATFNLDMQDSDAGTYTITLAGAGDLDFGAASQSTTLQITSDDSVGIELGSDSVTRGENIRYEVVGAVAGDLHLVQINQNDFRDDRSPENYSEIFRAVGDVQERGIIADAGGTEFLHEAGSETPTQSTLDSNNAEVTGAYAVVEIDDDDGLGVGSIDTTNLDESAVDVEVSDANSTNYVFDGDQVNPGDANALGGESIPVFDGEEVTDDNDFDVEEGDVSLSSPGQTYVIGSEVDVNGTAATGVDDVSLYVRDEGDFELLQIDGDDKIPVDADGTFEETDIVLSVDSGQSGPATDGNEILSLPGSYRIGVIDSTDADTDGDSTPENNLNTSAFNAGTSSQTSIRTLGQGLNAEYPSVVRGQIALDADGDVDINGSAPGANEVLFIAVGPRGNVVTQQITVDDDQTFEETDVPIGSLNKGAASLHIYSLGRDSNVGDATVPTPGGNSLDGFETYLSDTSVNSLSVRSLTADQVRSTILSETVEDTASDDLLISENVRIVDAQSNIVNVYQDGNQASGINPVAAGETMVVEGQTNLQPDDNTVTVELSNEDTTVDLAATEEWGADGQFTIEVDTTDAATGTYTLEVDDGENTVTEEVELVEQLNTPTPTPTEADTTPTATDSPTPTATPTATATEMPDTETASPTPTEGGGPGFGAVVALVALLAAALLATRRDN